MSIRCTVTGSMATKFSEMSILPIILDAIAADGWWWRAILSDRVYRRSTLSTDG